MFGWLPFRRSTQHHVRADVSLVSEVLGALMSARAGTGTPIPHDELPITQGLVTLIADSVADMELYAIDAPSTNPNAKRVSEEYPILEQPDPDEDRADTLHKIVQSMFWKGNAWGLRGDVLPNLAVESMTVLDPNEVGHRIHPRHSLKVEHWEINGRPVERDQMSWWKINDNPTKGPLGRSPVQVCAGALDMYGWAYRYLSDFFAQGGNPSSVFHSKLDLDTEKIRDLATEWIDSRKEMRPAFLPNWLELSIPPTTNEIEQVVRVLEFAAAEFARMTNVPTTLVNAPVAGYSLQYANVSDEFRRWLAVSLGTTWVRRVERGFTAMLPPGRWAKLDPAGLFPAELFPDNAGPGDMPAVTAGDLRALPAGEVAA